MTIGFCQESRVVILSRVRDEDGVRVGSGEVILLLFRRLPLLFAEKMPSILQVLAA